ncbi:phosphate transporter (Pho88) [Malassezia sp. CBS 17886]|nr:phosphate transporter (Pho88) [Malassezia sp. CBS 17886]
MNPAVTNMVVMFGAMQATKRIPFEEKPEYVTYARIGYVIAQLLCLAVFYYCSLKIKKTNDLTVLKYVNAKSAMSQEPGELVTTTHRDYDLAEIAKSMRGVLMGSAFVGFMHLYLGYTNPLVIQSILPLKNAFESNMAKLWIWGTPATGDLKRPFKPPASLFGGGDNGPKTDQNAIKEAEKATTVAKAE